MDEAVKIKCPSCGKKQTIQVNEPTFCESCFTKLNVEAKELDIDGYVDWLFSPVDSSESETDELGIIGKTFLIGIVLLLAILCIIFVLPKFS